MADTVSSVLIQWEIQCVQGYNLQCIFSSVYGQCGERNYWLRESKMTKIRISMVLSRFDTKNNTFVN